MKVRPYRVDAVAPVPDPSASRPEHRFVQQAGASGSSVDTFLTVAASMAAQTPNHRVVKPPRPSGTRPDRAEPSRTRIGSRRVRSIGQPREELLTLGRDDVVGPSASAECA